MPTPLVRTKYQLEYNIVLDGALQVQSSVTLSRRGFIVERSVQNTTLEYVAHAPWFDTNDHTLVISCSDPRYKESRDEYLKEHRGLLRPAEIKLPGGPAIILLSSPAFFTVRPLIALLHKHLHFDHVIGLAHRGCAYYTERYSRLNAEGVYRKQVEDLFEYEAEILRLIRGASVELFFEDLVDGHVGFRRVVK
jgi:hypothetical protein